MKYLIVVLLIFSIENELAAQTNIDSLLGAWNNKTLTDAGRLNAMNSILSDVVFLSNQPDSAMTLASLMFDKALENAIAIGISEFSHAWKQLFIA